MGNHVQPLPPSWASLSWRSHRCCRDRPSVAGCSAVCRNGGHAEGRGDTKCRGCNECKGRTKHSKGRTKHKRGPKDRSAKYRSSTEHRKVSECRSGARHKGCSDQQGSTQRKCGTRGKGGTKH